MRAYAFFAAPLLLTLAACGGGADDADADGDGTVSAEEVTAAAAKVTPLQPGQYAMTTELLEIVDPSLSTEEIAQAKAFLGEMGKMAPARCLAEDDARNGMVGIAQSLQNGDCTIRNLTSDADGLKAQMTCKNAGKEAEVALDGVSTGTTSQMTMTVVEPGAGEGQDKRMVMKIGMNRLGDCPA
ncbi:DUF3617 domain-containing protein [Qipengyuania sp.]|uniref:DUF3617 domain-containing protein n=1 Tax=Qipengyuania sp. TaxID=2004515 RepID=UPI0037356CE9